MYKTKPLLSKEQYAERISHIQETRCKCGGKMTITGTNRAGTAVDLTCTNPGCGISYHLPLTDPDQLPPPGTGHQFQKALDFNPEKEYRCKLCKTSIKKDQAIRTFEEAGIAMCIQCENKEIKRWI